jgi:hypothetical protein
MLRRMSTAKRSIYVVAVLFLVVAAAPQAALPEHTRIRNLEILAQVWGRLYLLHPRIPAEKLNWIQVLVEAIPKVEQAASTEQLIDLLNSAVLDPLDDPLTVAQPRTITTDRAYDSMRMTFLDGLSASAGNARLGPLDESAVTFRRINQSVGLLDATNPQDSACHDSLVISTR